MCKMVDERDIPLPINKDRDGLGELSVDKVTQVFTDVVKQDIAEKQAKGLPVARYDTEVKRSYLESADGTREYV